MSLVYLVTGSSRGLGRSITRAALSAGHRVLATARRPEQLDDLTGEFGDHVHPFALDVTDYDGARAAVAAAVSTFGRLDVVVNNAGYANLASVEDITIDDFRGQVDTNFFGVVNVTKAALPVLRAQGSGHVGDHLGGDPDKVAKVVLQVADLQQPPDRLLLGTDAYTYARLAAEARAASDEKWRELSVSTDEEGVTATNTDPLRRLA